MMIAYLSGKDTFELNIVEQQKRGKKSCGCGIVIISLRSIIFDEILFFSGIFFLFLFSSSLCLLALGDMDKR